MNLFRNLFGRNTAAPVDEPGPQSPVPPEDLFTDRREPEPAATAPEEPDAPIRRFLSRDWHALGLQDGFDYHGQEFLHASRRRIRAEFLNIIDEVILERRDQRRQLQDRLIQLQGLSEELYFRVEITMQEADHILSVLDQQKSLAVEEEGWLMQALHAYRLGYLQGVQDRLDSDDLLQRLLLTR
jgi:hypothetical protein